MTDMVVEAAATIATAMVVMDLAAVEIVAVAWLHHDQSSATSVASEVITREIAVIGVDLAAIVTMAAVDVEILNLGVVLGVAVLVDVNVRVRRDQERENHRVKTRDRLRRARDHRVVVQATMETKDRRQSPLHAETETTRVERNQQLSQRANEIDVARVLRIETVNRDRDQSLVMLNRFLANKNGPNVEKLQGTD
jgi:hypothetical protein